MTAVIFTTSGDGLWSKNVRNVRITDMRLGYLNDEDTFGELRVYFDRATWSVYNDGLIYTDLGFMTDLRNFLALHGLNNLDVDYSEQGMQGVDYVSLDVGAEFLAAWEQKFGVLECA